MGAGFSNGSNPNQDLSAVGPRQPLATDRARDIIAERMNVGPDHLRYDERVGEDDSHAMDIILRINEALGINLNLESHCGDTVGMLLTAVGRVTGDVPAAPIRARTEPMEGD